VTASSLKKLCTPRPSVFDATKRDTVLDLSDLAEGKIDAKSFFAENFITEGMKTLLSEAFRRLEGKSEQGLFKLTQSMGGGKTHNLLALGLLAQNPGLRDGVMGAFYKKVPSTKVRVVAFTGRESDASLGIWGEIATQLGKREAFKEYYSPLRAPGQTAWVNLLKGEPTLVLLDELPPYLDNARSVTIGNSDLARVTGTALANLFGALGKGDLGNVAVVLTDLTASYEQGSQALAQATQDLQKETSRTAMSLEPVRINTDEFSQILRKRLFERLPGDAEIAEVAQAYGKAVRDAKQMDVTNQSPEQFAQQIQESYPFHPAIKDLYARFRENPGFQQTRALIRLMRIVVARLWEGKEADEKQLVSAHDIDLNDRETLSEITLINPTLENAVSHDIAAQGRAVAEVMDENLGGTDTRDACRLLLVASLANVPNAVLGLSLPEMTAYLCAPGRNVSRMKADVLEKLATAAWYLHSNRDGKLYFRNVQNLVAKLESTARSYVREQSIKELRERLTELFRPVNGWCYQEVLPLPAIDEIQLSQDKVTLVICEPFVGQGLRPELAAFYEQVAFKNRVGFLTGSRNTFESLLETAKRLKAIQHILDEMSAEKVPETDPQFKQADDLLDKIQFQFLSAVKETFSTLHFPTQQGLVSADFQMKFENNKYEGEAQVYDLLKAKQKFTDETTGDTFRKKCEQRLFTAQSMVWTEVRRRAAVNAQWQWHRREALDSLRDDCVHRDVWRTSGAYVDKGPFQQDSTSVTIQERTRNEETGEVELRVIPVHADKVYAEVGGVPSTASQLIENGVHRTGEMEVQYLAVDSTGQHQTGSPVAWRNRITLRHRQFSKGAKKMLELLAAPRAQIRYSTDGSDPKVAGGAYDAPFAIPQDAPIVLAYAEREGIESEVLRVPISWDKSGGFKFDAAKPAVWRHKHDFQTTQDTYTFLSRLDRYEASAAGLEVLVNATPRWVELKLVESMKLPPHELREAVDAIRKLLPDGQVGIVAAAIHFDVGQKLLDWVNEVKVELLAEEVKQ